MKRINFMLLTTKILILAIALLHLFFLYMEMFAWETIGKKAFKAAMPSDLFAPTKVLAANQGLYNGFLAAGLIWSLFISDLNWAKNVALFFLVCISLAGTYGAYSASKRIFYIQALPAIIAILWILL